MLMSHTQNRTQILTAHVMFGQVRLVVVFWVGMGGEVDNNHLELWEHVSVSLPLPESVDGVGIGVHVITSPSSYSE